MQQLRLLHLNRLLSWVNAVVFWKSFRGIREVVLSGITNVQEEWIGLHWQLHSPFPALLYLLAYVFLIISSCLCPPASFLSKSIMLLFPVIFQFQGPLGHLKQAKVLFIFSSMRPPFHFIFVIYLETFTCLMWHSSVKVGPACSWSCCESEVSSVLPAVWLLLSCMVLPFQAPQARDNGIVRSSCSAAWIIYMVFPKEEFTWDLLGFL